MTSRSPFVVTLLDGRVLEVVDQTTKLAVDDSVSVEIEGHCSVQCYLAYVIRNAAGDLIHAGWSGRPPIDIPELSLDYVAAECVGSNRGVRRAFDMSLWVDGTEVRNGDGYEAKGFRIFNGLALKSYAVWATHVPYSWYEGTIEAL